MPQMKLRGIASSKTIGCTDLPMALCYNNKNVSEESPLCPALFSMSMPLLQESLPSGAAERLPGMHWLQVFPSTHEPRIDLLPVIVPTATGHFCQTRIRVYIY
jgi:hypothetical protein